MMKVWEDKRIPNDWNEATVLESRKKAHETISITGVVSLCSPYLVKFLPKLSLID